MANNRLDANYLPCRLCNICGPHEIDLFDANSRELRETVSKLYDVEIEQTDASTKMCKICSLEIDGIISKRKMCAATNSLMKNKVPNGTVGTTVVDTLEVEVLVEAWATKGNVPAQGRSSVEQETNAENRNVVAENHRNSPQSNGDTSPAMTTRTAMDPANPDTLQTGPSKRANSLPRRISNVPSRSSTLATTRTNSDSSAILLPSPQCGEDTQLASSNRSESEEVVNGLMICDVRHIRLEEWNEINCTPNDPPEEYMSSLEYESESEIDDIDRESVSPLPTISNSVVRIIDLVETSPRKSPAEAGCRLQSNREDSTKENSVRRGQRPKPAIKKSKSSTATAAPKPIHKNSKPKPRSKAPMNEKSANKSAPPTNRKKVKTSKHMDGFRFKRSSKCFEFIDST